MFYISWYDSIGLPAEQYAIRTGQHPRKTTSENINMYRRQLDRIGFSLIGLEKSEHLTQSIINGLNGYLF